MFVSFVCHQNDHRQRQQPPRSPDWKSRPVLPPIQPSGDQLNFHHSQISPQQPKKNTTTSTNDSYQQHYGYNDKYLPPQTTKQSLNDHDRSSPTKQGDNSFQPKDYSEHGKPKEYDWKPAAGYSYLPTQPIALNKDQEMFLMHKLAMDMDEAACTVDQVKAVYEEMAVNDHNLTGMGSFTDLRLALQKHGVSAIFISNISWSDLPILFAQDGDKQIAVINHFQLSLSDLLLYCWLEYLLRPEC